MKLGRNEPCHCGSGKKYKRCHLAEDAQARSAASEPLSGAAVARHMGRHMLASAGVSDEVIGLAEQYFAAKDAGRGPAQQMMEYAAPLIDQSDGTEAGISKALSLAMVFWNLATLPEADRGTALREMVRHDAIAEDHVAFQEMAEAMIARHATMFPELHTS